MNHKIIQDKPLPFTPIKIELTLESEEELNEFQARLDTSLEAIIIRQEDQDIPIGKVDILADAFYDLWDDLDDIRISLKGGEEGS